jgi:hypothetical protein
VAAVVFADDRRHAQRKFAGGKVSAVGRGRCAGESLRLELSFGERRAHALAASSPLRKPGGG